MADSDDLELASEDDPMSGTANGRPGRGANPVRTRINIKLRPGSKSRNVAAASTQPASKKQAKTAPSNRDASLTDRGPMEVTTSEHQYDNYKFILLPLLDDEDVNKALEFSPMKLPGANSSEPFHRNQKLMWNQKVNLLGEKVVDPLIHSCEKCALPILIYGRMIPCKHVFCFSCAKLTEKSCPRCSQPVVRIEQSALGTVFVCTFGGTKHGVSGCHRTYLSQRDLQSHVTHRHYGGGREPPPPPQRSMQPVGPPTPKVQQAPPGVPTTMSFALSQQQQQQLPAAHDSNSGLIYRSMQQPQGPPAAGHPHMVLAQHPSMSQPPPQMTQPPPQHMISSHGTTPHVMNSLPPTAGGPPGMMPGSHGMPPSAMMVQSMPQSAPRGTNLITVQLHDDGDYRVDAGQNSAGSVRMQLATTQSDNAMAHYPPPMQQYPPPGNLVQSYAVSEHHQMTTMVRPMMTHPMSIGPGQAQMVPGQGQMGPGQVMVTYSHQMGPPPSGQSQRLGPPPQLQPQAMHGGPPPQGMMSQGPHPQGMMTSVQQAPQQTMPPQGLHGGPQQQPQGLRTGPPQGYAGPPPHLPDQRQQFVGGQQMQWTTGPPPGGPPQMQQHMGQRPPQQGNIGSSQSMQYYQ